MRVLPTIYDAKRIVATAFNNNTISEIEKCVAFSVQSVISNNK
jgi:hypothetical protein